MVKFLDILVSLNPCCNGIYLIIDYGKFNECKRLCLNPCCNGIYLIIEAARAAKKLLKFRLNPCCNGIYLIISRE